MLYKPLPYSPLTDDSHKSWSCLFEWFFLQFAGSILRHLRYWIKDKSWQISLSVAWFDIYLWRVNQWVWSWRLYVTSVWLCQNYALLPFSYNSFRVLNKSSLFPQSIPHSSLKRCLMLFDIALTLFFWLHKVAE